MPQEVLQFKDGTPFYCDNPVQGVGATIGVSCFGATVCIDSRWQLVDWHGERAAARFGMGVSFWKVYVEQQRQHCKAYAACGQTGTHDDNGDSIKLSRNP